MIKQHFTDTALRKVTIKAYDKHIAQAEIVISLKEKRKKKRYVRDLRQRQHARKCSNQTLVG